jgi:diacylglycerol kinase family enzyme
VSTSGIVVIMNAQSGRDDTPELHAQVEQEFARAGRPVQVMVVGEQDTIEAATQRAIHGGATIIVAAGGDGTISAVAGALADTSITLGVIAAGTLNHFAKDLGIPLEVPAAIDIICRGHVREVDVSEVNDTVFVNNSSVGLYPRLVELRAAHKGRGVTKWVVAAWATVRVMRECPTIGVRLVIDGEPLLRRTPLVFVGNNAYNMEGFDAGSRDALDTGTLAIYVVRERTGLQLLSLVLAVIRGTATANGQLELLHAQSAELDTKTATLSVAVDGEVRTMDTPLRYRMRARALRVLAPPV